MSNYTGLAISSKRHSGKTTAARLIMKSFPKVFSDILCSFGRPLKAEWEHDTGLKVPVDPAAKERWRCTIQKYSDKILAGDPGRWCRKFKEQFKIAKAKGLVVCDDVRQDKDPSKELTTILGLGMVPMRIECAGRVRRDVLNAPDNFEADRHRSEVGMDKHPYWIKHPKSVIHNDGDEDFELDILNFVWDNFTAELLAAGYTRDIQPSKTPKEREAKLKQKYVEQEKKKIVDNYKKEQARGKSKAGNDNKRGGLETTKQQGSGSEAAKQGQAGCDC